MDFIAVLKEQFGATDDQFISERECIFKRRDKSWSVKREEQLEEELLEICEHSTLCFASRENNVLNWIQLILKIKEAYYLFVANIEHDETSITVFRCDSYGNRKSGMITKSIRSELLNQVQEKMKAYILNEPKYRLRAITGDYDIPIGLISKIYKAERK